MSKQILKNKAMCRKCGTTIESTHVHDFVSCGCRRIFVDGGREYLRRGFEYPEDFIELSEFAEEEVIVSEIS